MAASQSFKSSRPISVRQPDEKADYGISSFLDAPLIADKEDYAVIRPNHNSAYVSHTPVRKYPSKTTTTTTTSNSTLSSKNNDSTMSSSVVAILRVTSIPLPGRGKTNASHPESNGNHKSTAKNLGFPRSRSDSGRMKNDAAVDNGVLKEKVSLEILLMDPLGQVERGISSRPSSLCCKPPQSTSRQLTTSRRRRPIRPKSIRAENHPLLSQNDEVSSPTARSSCYESQSSGNNIVSPSCSASFLSNSRRNLTSKFTKALRSTMQIGVSTLSSSQFNPWDFRFARDAHSSWASRIDDLPTKSCSAPVAPHAPEFLSFRESTRSLEKVPQCKVSVQMQTYQLFVEGISQKRGRRENSNYLRMIVLEANMKRHGKLRRDKPYHARAFLPPRGGVALYLDRENEQSEVEHKVPERWVGESIND